MASDLTALYEEWKKTPSKKNTRKWCRGKVGVEHQPEIRRLNGGWVPAECRPHSDRPDALFPKPWLCWHDSRCAKCGKVIIAFLDWRDCPDVPAALVNDPAWAKDRPPAITLVRPAAKV